MRAAKPLETIDLTGMGCGLPRLSGRAGMVILPNWRGDLSKQMGTICPGHYSIFAAALNPLVSRR
jgi:hypothetical protein